MPTAIPGRGARRAPGSRVFGAIACLGALVVCGLQAQEIRLEHLTVDDGLPASTTYCVFQDGTGYLWFGTAGGLGRFDGYSFRVFRHRPDDPTSIIADNVWAISEDGGGHLGLHSGLRGGDLRPACRHVRHYPAKGGDSEEPFLENVWELEPAPDGGMWIATDSGLYRFDPKANRLESVAEQLGPSFASLAEGVGPMALDPQGSLWFVSGIGGLGRLDGTRLRVYRRGFHLDGLSLSSDDLWRVAVGPDGKVYAGGGPAIVDVLDPATGTSPA